MPNFTDRIWALLPAIYRIEDSKLADIPLRRLLEVIGPTLDFLKAKIDDFPDLFDVDVCPANFLPYLGALVGHTYDPTVSVDSQRDAIRDSIERYRRKGTEYQLVRDLRDLGWTGSVLYTYPYVMRLGTRSKLTTQKLPGYHYSWGVYILTQALAIVDFLEVVYWHQVAGTRVIIDYGTFRSLSEPPPMTTSHALTVTMTNGSQGRFRLNISQLAGDERLASHIATAHSMTVQ